MADRARGLIDIGAILALVDPGDRWHRPCVEAFAKLHLPLASSAAILTEVFHMVEGPSQFSDAWGFLGSGRGASPKAQARSRGISRFAFLVKAALDALRKTA